MAPPSPPPPARAGLTLRKRAFSVVGAAIIGLGTLAYIMPLLVDVVTDWRIGPTVPVAGAHLEGGCTTRLFLVRCEGTLTAPVRDGPEAHRKIDYLFLGIEIHDREVAVLADRARPDRLTTDLGQGRLWGRTALMVFIGPVCLLIGIGALVLGGVTLLAPARRAQVTPVDDRSRPRHFIRRGAGGEATALYRITPAMGLGEVRRAGAWVRGEDVYRRFIDGFDADIEPLADDALEQAVSQVDARAERARRRP